ncbi:unnamed protein product [Rhizoctonia solani]|uniref:Major facilitator superfamily (MFS) profile domain-containing protein n=1 Tax=Rhizoctonia solani TaxID=456999 RepID=A0A8H3D5D5_9AGAM|nr:unnamed protein product [Rhizoctonia solani]
MATHQQPELSGIAPEGSRGSAPVSPRDEKVPSFDEKRDNEKPLVHDSDHGHDSFGDEKLDPHEPFPIDPEHEDEEYQLTLRALVVGWILGAVVGASNIYLGLKTGFTFGPQLFGAIFGFAILKPLSKAFTMNFLPGWVWGGEFGPKENCTVQTAATSAGGMGIIFVSAVPAMYRMNLMSEFPDADVGRLIALTVSAAFFGVFFAIPLRKYYILKEKLMFPTPTATAFTIRALHAGRTGAEAARKKSIGLASSFGIAFCFKVAAGYLPGVIWDWHIGWTFYRLGWTNMIELDNFGWWLEFTPAFFGAGMLSGMNASWSFFGGFVLAWGIIAPSLIATGGAVGKQRSPDEFPEVWSYQAMSFKTLEEYTHAASPRYWLLWPGVLIMLVYSFAEMFMSSRSAFKSFGKIGPAIVNGIRNIRTRGDPNTIHHEEDNDPTRPEDRVPTWAWAGGLVISLVMSCALLATQFSLNVGEVILALVLGFIFSFIGVQSSGYTDINPVSTVAKASQLIFGGVTKGTGAQIKPAQEINLVAGIVAAGSAAQACDMTGDLKTGHLLRAKPKNQFVAQVTGSIVSVFLGVGLFVLFTKASPCILYPPDDGICSYGAPSVAAWQAVAIAVTADKLPIPPASGYTAIGLSIAAVITVVIKHLWIPRKYWNYIPNWNAIGLAFVVPQTYYGTAMAAGATLNYFWERRNPRNFDMYMFPISAGMLAGEGLGGVLLALLSVAGVGADGVKYGTSVGCTSTSSASRASSEHTRRNSTADENTDLADVEKTQVPVVNLDQEPVKGEQSWEVFLDSTDDPKHRKTAQKWLIVFILATSSTCVTCASSVASMARSGIQKEFGVSSSVAILGISLYVEGLGVGPLLLGPLSEFFGRRHIYWISFVFFVLLNFPVAFAPNIAVYLVFRFLTGFSGAAFLSVAGGTVADLFANDKVASPMALYTISPFIGPVLGPAFSGFINQNTNWRWTFYTIIIWATVQLVELYLLVPETYEPVLRARKAQQLRKTTGDDRWWAPLEKNDKSIAQTIITSCYKPFEILAFEPMALLLDIWCALLLGILYLCFTAFPTIFGVNHGFNTQSVGLTFIGIGIGMIFALASQPLWNRLQAKYTERHQGAPPPETRLFIGMAGAVLVPVGLFWLAFTTPRSVHWVVPIIASIPFGTGTVPYAASAMAGNSFLRSAFAAAFPLISGPMYNRLGTMGATALLAGLTVLMAPLPFIFYRLGPKLRQNSRFT